MKDSPGMGERAPDDLRAVAYSKLAPESACALRS